MTKLFHVGDVLSITTDKLLSPTRISGVYEILNFVLSDNLFTHQLPRAATASKDFLEAQFPELKDIEVPEITSLQVFQDWIDRQDKKYGKLAVRAMNEDELRAAYQSKGPITELIEMRGGNTDGIIMAKVGND